MVDKLDARTALSVLADSSAEDRYHFVLPLLKALDERDALRAELEAARKQEPAVLIEGKKIFWNPEYKGVHDGGFYASPVPAQQSADNGRKSGVYSSDPLACGGCLSGCPRCRFWPE